MFIKVLVVIIIIFLANIGGLIYLGWDSLDIEAGFTGNSIKHIASGSNEKMNIPVRILFIGQWVALGLLLLFAGYRDKKMGSQKVELESIKINPSKEQTDLDKLYNILKERKQLKIKNISELFHVNKDIAMEWAKILESGDLVVIDYPMLGGAVVNYNDERDKENDDMNSEKDESNEKRLRDNEEKEIIERKKTEEIKKGKKNKKLILILLFLITVGLAGYPLYWLMNNRWDLGIIRADMFAFVLSLLFLLSFVIFLIALMRFMFRKKKAEVKEVHSNDKQTDKKKDLKIEKKDEEVEKKIEVKKEGKKSKGILIFLLLLITIGLAIYPAFWMVNNNWDYMTLIDNPITLILSALFALSLLIFLIVIIKVMFGRKKKNVREFNDKDKQTDKKKNLKIEKKREVKERGKGGGIFVFLFFLISLGLGVYPAYWLINNNWDFRGLINNILALILSVLFVLSVFIFLITLMRFMFQKKKVRQGVKKEVDKGKRVKVKSKKKK